MSMPTHGEILLESLGRTAQEWFVLLIAVFVPAAVSTALLWPFASRLVMIPYLEAEMAMMYYEKAGLTPTVLIGIALVNLFVYSFLLVLWIRASLLGRDEMFEGGIYMLFVRSLWTIIRQISATVWILIAAAVGFIFFLLSGSFVPVLVTSGIAFVMITPLVGASVVAAAADLPIGIRRSARVLGTDALKLIPMGIFLIILLGGAAFAVDSWLSWYPKPTVDIPKMIAPYLWSNFLGQAIAGLGGLYWFTHCGVVLGHRMEEE